MPTVENEKLKWNPYTDPDAKKFSVYFSEGGLVKTYGDTKRFVVTLPATELRVRDFIPNAKGTVCFVITAVDAVGNESKFSNEACGWFGLPSPAGVEVK